MRSVSSLHRSSEARAPLHSSLHEGEILPIRVVQRRYAAWALSQCGGHRGHAAEKLGVDVKTLYNWLSESRPDEVA